MIEYTLSADDQAALTAVLWHRDGRADVVQLGAWLAGFIMCAAVGLAALVITQGFGRGPASALGALTLPLLVVAWTAVYLLVPTIRRGAVRRFARMLLARRSFPRHPVRIWLDREGLHSQGVGEHRVMNPRSVRDVVETSEHVFLFVSSTQAIVIPKRAGSAEVKWLAEGIRAARARFDPPSRATIRTLELVLTFEDYRAIERAPGATRPGDKAFNRYRTRRLLPLTAVVLLVVAAIEAATKTPPLRSGLIAVAIAGLAGALLWVVAGVHHRTIQARRARIAFQRSGERLRLCIEPDGVRDTTQDGSGLHRWADLTLDQTPDYYYLHTGPRTAIVIPRSSGPEVDSFAALIRSRIQAATSAAL